MTKPRSAAASVVLNGSTLWLTGGYTQDINEETKTTEFVQVNGPSPGPDLPLKVGYHCLVSLNDSTTDSRQHCHFDWRNAKWKIFRGHQHLLLQQ
jgi:hypothetical protein